MRRYDDPALLVGASGLHSLCHVSAIAALTRLALVAAEEEHRSPHVHDVLFVACLSSLLGIVLFCLFQDVESFDTALTNRQMLTAWLGVPRRIPGGLKGYSKKINKI